MGGRETASLAVHVDVGTATREHGTQGLSPPASQLLPRPGSRVLATFGEGGRRTAKDSRWAQRTRVAEPTATLHMTSQGTCWLTAPRSGQAHAPGSHVIHQGLVP